MGLAEKLRNFLQQLPNLWRTFLLIRDAAPGWVLCWFILLSVQGMLPVAVVYLTRSIVDTLVAVLGAGEGWAGLQPLFKPVGLMAAVLLGMVAIRSLIKIVRTAQALLVEEKITGLVQEKSVTLDLADYESSEYFDRLYRVRNEAAHRPLELVESLGSLLQNTITLGAMAGVLFQYSIWAPAALLVSTLPVLYVVLDHRFRQYRWRKRNTEHERRAWYYDWLITSRENAAEVRLFGTGEHFRKAFFRIKETLRHETLHMNTAEAMAELLAAVFALLLTGLAMGWMIVRVVAGSATLGDMALFYQAFNQGQQLLRSLLENVGQMYGSSLFLADFFDFLAIEPHIISPSVPAALPASLDRGISFTHVSFRYPLTDKSILADFCLEIPAGQTTAIVGVNGAGKSTLVKLICRLYDPDSGCITFDGKDIRQADPADVRQMVTVLFQEPVRYNLSVEDNIRLGDLSVPPGSDEVRSAIRAGGAEQFIARLPEGINTELGRWFPESTDLSGGEWQRLALARAFLRRSPVIVLDEPTSAMDSWSEMEWLHNFQKLAEGKTALVITHRFTTAMQADIIHVMDQGRIVETGTHQELLAAGGMYAFSWSRQMQGNISSDQSDNLQYSAK